MIYVTTGTTEFPFHTMDVVVSFLQGRFPKKDIMYQANTTFLSSSANLKIKHELRFDKHLALIKKAELVISHAGPGNVFLILENAKYKPIIIPRRQQFGEHLNDHQEHFARFLSEQKSTLAQSLYTWPITLPKIEKVVLTPKGNSWRKVRDTRIFDLLEREISGF